MPRRLFFVASFSSPFFRHLFLLCPAGDMGRTSPSLGDLLGCETRIAFLDVTDVHDDGLLDH